MKSAIIPSSTVTLASVVAMTLVALVGVANGQEVEVSFLGIHLSVRSGNDRACEGGAPEGIASLPWPRA